MKKNLFLLAFFISLSLFAQNFSLGQEIVKNRKYYSPTKAYYMIFQYDGNLVIYNRRSNSSVWDSKTSNVGSKSQFQADGNFVIYNGSNKAIFSTNTQNRGGILKLQDDGNLVIYNRGNSPVWSSIDNKVNNGESWNANNSNINKGYKFVVGDKIYSPNRSFYVVFQRDGNLAVYSTRNNVLWDTKTANRGARAEFQDDGNLVVYNRSGQSIFSSQTGTKNGTTLKMQDDGNLVIYGSGDASIWASDSSK